MKQFNQMSSWYSVYPYIVTRYGRERKVKCPIRKNTVLLGIQMNTGEEGYIEYHECLNGDLQIIQKTEIRDEERIGSSWMSEEEKEHWRNDKTLLQVSTVKEGMWNPGRFMTMRKAVKQKLQEIGYPDAGLKEYVLREDVLNKLYLIDYFIEEDILEYLENGMEHDINKGFYTKGVRSYAG